MDCSPLENHAAGGGLDQVTQRDDKGVDLQALVGQDLLDALTDPRRLDDVGSTLVEYRMVLEPGVGLRIPVRPVAVPGQIRIETQLSQIAHEKARSRASGSGDDEMSTRVLGCWVNLRLDVVSPLLALRNRNHTSAPRASV